MNTGQPLQRQLRETMSRATHARFESRGYATHAPLDPEPLRQLLSDRALGIERAKGIVRHPDGRIIVIHAVAGRVDCETMPPEASPVGLDRLVLIGVQQRWQPTMIDAALSEQGWRALAPAG